MSGWRQTYFRKPTISTLLVYIGKARTLFSQPDMSTIAETDQMNPVLK